MLELVMLLATVVAMVKIADHEDRSPIIWGALTIAIGVGAIMILPWPFLRMMLVLIFCFGLMAVAKIVRGTVT